MIWWSWKLIFGSTPAQFESAYGLEESVRRLAAATGRTVFSALTSQRAVGKVTAKCVSLQRVIPFVGNSFKPFFRGSFRDEGGRVQLVGAFGLHPFFKFFAAFWFGALLTMTLLGVLHGATTRDPDWVFPLAGVGMLLAGWGLLLFCAWLSRNDIAWLSQVIRQALAEQSNG